jgi:hypothetical protein
MSQWVLRNSYCLVQHAEGPGFQKKGREREREKEEIRKKFTLYETITTIHLLNFLFSQT